MGTHASHDLLGVFAALWLIVSIYFVSGIRTAFGVRADFFESVAWGKFFAGAVYAGLSVLFFWMCLLR
jgi:hypothetical protein